LLSSSILKQKTSRMPMAATPPSDSKPAGDDRNLVPVDATTAVTFEDKMQLFWQKNRMAVYALCVLILLAIIGKGGWDYMARQKELEIEKAYAAAKTTEQLKAFSAAQGGHTLAGVAELRIADEAFAAGKVADAVAGYEKALATLKSGPLAARAKLGRAVAKAQTGKAEEAKAELMQLADDANQFKAVRAEAAFHLTGLAVEAGNAADAQKFVDQINQIEPMGMWAQRAMSLRATLPATPAPAAPASSTTPDAPKKDEPSVQVKLPGAK
jgi:hypothetical protein